MRNGKNKKSYVCQRKNYNLGQYNNNINSHNNTNYVAKSNDNMTINNSDLNKDFHLSTPKYNNSNLKFGIKPYESNGFINKNSSPFKAKNNYILHKENKISVFSLNKKEKK